ncbi:MAG: phenylalanine--tRNA ligase subunit beta [Bacteroidales bacterium]|nr:phenylalanine--tRNA ligase subunit beta [Bacteroidales bacterium]HOI32053.1 phenylalanine--tRNA ligase subunit beta [Bacteroidales bacterium]
MKISYNWLKQYINCDLPAEEVAQVLTATGLEVEDIIPFESVKGSLKGIVTGQVLSCIQHPNADRLSLTTVDVGLEEPLAIVCGAPNVAAGQKVLVATVGTMLYNADDAFEIKKSKIRGELSEGMICAEDELGLGDSHDGIMVLPDETQIGIPASRLFDIEQDVIFEIGLTPNRSDAMSHIGVARDLAAALNHRAGFQKYKLQMPSVETFSIDNQDLDIEVEVENTHACPRYTGSTISELQVAPSPEWMQNRLKAIGVRPINNIVDITNYVLFETGQPLHAFDAKTVTGNKIIVKTLANDTPFVTLDEQERKLTANDLMICNVEAPMCIGGVFGGLKSGVTEETSAIFLESACFDSRYIRKTARHHNLQTDASFRFERGSDISITTYALKRALLLMKEIAGGKISSEIKDVLAKSIEPKKVKLSFDYLNKVAGQPIEPAIVRPILENLGMIILNQSDEAIEMEVPGYKVDVYRPADVVEEVLRIYGYNNIRIPEKINAAIHAGENNKTDQIQQQIADMLAFNGFFEVMNNSLTKSAYTQKHPAFDETKNVKILNPLSNELDVLRQTLVYGLLETIAYNTNRKNPNLKCFEFGNVYQYDKQKTSSTEKALAPYQEYTQLDLAITGLREEENWNHEDKPTDFYDLKYFAEGIFSKMGFDLKQFKIQTLSNELYDFALSYELNEKMLMQIGKLSMKTLKLADLEKAVFHASINWTTLMKINQKKQVKLFTAVPKFPSVRRDLAMVFDQSASFHEIRTTALEAEKKLLKSVGIFDVYEGDKIPKGKKSYALSFVLQDNEKTLTDKIIEKSMNRIRQALEQSFDATLRE